MWQLAAQIGIIKRGAVAALSFSPPSRYPTLKPVTAMPVLLSYPPPSSPLVIEPISMRIPDACRFTGISRSTLYLLIARGDVEIVKMGAATLVLTESLRELIERQRGSQLSRWAIPIADRSEGKSKESKPTNRAGSSESRPPRAQRSSMPLFEER